MGPRHSLLLARPGFADTLSRELIERFGIESTVVHPAAVAVAESVALPHVSDTVFARQSLPLAVGIEGKTASDAAAYIIERLKILSKRSNRKSLPWTLHAFSSDDDAGLQLASKVAGAVKEGIKSTFLILRNRAVYFQTLQWELEIDYFFAQFQYHCSELVLTALRQIRDFRLTQQSDKVGSVKQAVGKIRLPLS